MIEALAEPLAKRKLSPVDRFGVVSDVVATTEGGLTESTVALEMIAALREEPDYVVWGGLTGGLASLEAVVEDEPLRDQLDRFGHWLVQPNAARLGWEAKPDEPAFDTLMRPLVLQQAVRFDDEAITRQARKLFKEYLEGQSVSPDLRPVLLYAGARHGESDEFDAILDRYRSEQSPQVKISYLSALGRFRKPRLIDRFLDLGLSEDVRPQDIYIIIAWAFRNREARVKAWQWMKDNWDEWIRRYGAGGHMLERFPIYAGSGFATHKMAEEIGEFFDSHPHPATKRPTQQAVEAVELKADWYDRDKLKIQTFLETWERSHPQ
jgi:aminopeptidase 2